MCLGAQLKEYQYVDGYHHRGDVLQAVDKMQEANKNNSNKCSLKRELKLV